MDDKNKIEEEKVEGSNKNVEEEKSPVQNNKLTHNNSVEEP